MPIFNENENIFVNKFKTAVPWDEIPGNEMVSVIVQNEIHRGFNLNVSASKYDYINLLMSRWAEFRLFAYAKAEATLQAQAQTPLNLFNAMHEPRAEAGLAVRIQAIARAAVGIGLNLSMTPEEIIEKLHQHPHVKGLFGELLSTFLEETTLVGSAYAQVAVAIMAYANFVVSGSILTTTKNKEEPSFKFIFDAGMGFKGGGGYRLSLDFNFNNPRRMINRFSDILNDQLIKGIEEKMDLSIEEFESVKIMDFFLKVGLRTTYEVGKTLPPDYLHIYTPNRHSKPAVNVVIQEGQRWFLQRFISFAIMEFNRLIKELGSTSTETINFLNKLDKMHYEENIFLSYWDEIVNDALALFTFPHSESNWMEQWYQNIGMLWSAAYLGKKFLEDLYNQEDSSLYQYTHLLDSQPPSQLANFIDYKIHNNVSNKPLNEEDLLIFLLKLPLEKFLKQQKDGNEMLEFFTTAFNRPGLNVALAIFYFDGVYDKDEIMKAPRLFLENALNPFQIKSKYVIRKVTPLIEQAFSNSPKVITIYKQALVPALELASDVTFVEIINDFQGMKVKQLEESLSSIILSLIGQTMFQIFETVFTKVQQNIESELKNVAANLKELKIIQMLRRIIRASGFNQLEHFDALVEEGLKTVSEHLVPLSNQTKERFFYLASDILNPIPIGRTKEFAYNLKVPTYVPKEDKIKGLSLLIAEMLGAKMFSFSVSMLSKLYQIILDFLYEELRALMHKFTSSLREIIDEINKIIKTYIIDQITEIALQLALIKIDNLELSVPDWLVKNEVKDALRSSARRIIRTSVENMISSPINLALNTLEASTDEILDILKNNDLNMFQSYLINKITDELTKTFKSRHYAFNLTINVDFSKSIPGFGNLLKTFSKDINIGTIEVPDDDIIKVIQGFPFEDKLPFKQYYDKLIPLTNPIFAKQEEIQIFITDMNRVVPQFHNNLEPPRSAIFVPELLIRPLGYRGYLTSIDLIIHYPTFTSLSNENQRFKNINAIYLNNKLLPIASFYTPNFAKDKINRQTHGSIIMKRLELKAFQPGVNVISIHYVDKKGKDRYYYYPFKLF
ncbi:hypothetical protein [Priestia aryabhattai]|uniref:hypothetical protein n=1 Tax=Priestia aryabhattai TaxID=412384 RepID=UPI003C9790A1